MLYIIYSQNGQAKLKSRDLAEINAHYHNTKSEVHINNTNISHYA